MERITASFVWSLLALATPSLVGCVEGDGDPTPAPSTPDDDKDPSDDEEDPDVDDYIDIDGDGEVDAPDGDLDGDGLRNELELEIGTNPLLADSDGDKYDDFYEYSTNPRVDPTLPFHPLIADIPQIRVEILRRPAFTLTTTEGETESDSISITEAETINRSESTSLNNTRSFGHSSTFAAKVGISNKYEIGVGFNATIGFSAETSFGHSFTSNEAYSLGRSVSESIGTSLQQARQTTLQTSRQVSGGQIVTALRLYNAGNIAVNVENLSVAYAHLHSNGTVSQALSLAPDGAALGFTLPPGEVSTPLSYRAVLVGADAAYAMAEDMARAGSIQVIADSMLLTNETGGNFTDVYTNTKNRSARVMIDPGPTFTVGEHGGVLDKHIVATPRVNPAYVAGEEGAEPFVDTTLADLLTLLEVDFEVSERQVGDELTVGITEVNGTAEDLDNNSFWMVALETTRNGVNGTIYFAPFWSYRPEDIAVVPGETVQLIYSADRDGDGVPARIEIAAGTSDQDVDTDADGVSDALEIFGWCSVDGAPVLAEVDANLAPTGACADAGADVWFTDPTQADTDGDGEPDLDDAAPLERARFESAGVTSISVIHNGGAGAPSAPAPGEEPTPPLFELVFDEDDLTDEAPSGFAGAFAGGEVLSGGLLDDGVIREEYVRLAIETENRAEAVFVTGPGGGARVPLQRDFSDPQGRRFLTGFEELEIKVGMGQSWTIEVLPEQAAAECGFTGTYSASCDHETYRVTLDSAPGLPASYVSAPQNGDNGWTTNAYPGDSERYQRTLRAEKDGWDVSPRFENAHDGRIEAAFFVMCDEESQLNALHEQAFTAPVTNLAVWTASGGTSLLDGVGGCQWAYHLADAVAPTNGAYTWDWSHDPDDVVVAKRRRHTYHTRLYTVARDLSGNYQHTALTRTFKSVDAPKMKITTKLTRIDWVEVKRKCLNGEWCEDENNVDFFVKLKGRAGTQTASFSEVTWHGRGNQNGLDRSVTDADTPSGDTDPDDTMARLFDDDNSHWIDAKFPECNNSTANLSPRDWSKTFEQLGAHDDFQGSATGVLYSDAVHDPPFPCSTDWRIGIDIHIEVTWESGE